MRTLLEKLKFLMRNHHYKIYNESTREIYSNVEDVVASILKDEFRKSNGMEIYSEEILGCHASSHGWVLRVKYENGWIRLPYRIL